MRMKQRITTLVLLASLVTMLAGCSETFSVKKGEQVRLTVFTNSDPGTKTTYAGYTAGNTFERIRWNVGDNIRIFSMNTDIVKAKWYDGRAVTDYYDYKISDSKDSLDRYSRGKLTWSETSVTAGQGYGLIWVNDPYNATLYGVYPTAEPRYDQNDATKILAFKNMTIPASQGATPDMTHAYMVSAPTQFKESGYVDEHGQSIAAMDMQFFPFFNAFDIEFQTLDGGPFKVNSVKLSSTAESLAGGLEYVVNQGWVDQISGAPTISNVTHVNGTSSVTASLSSLSDEARTVTSDHPVRVTLLTLPPQNANYITNLTLTINYNDNKEKSLALNKSGSPIQFVGFHKARINGLAMNGFPDNIQFKFVVQPWEQESITIDTSTGSINMSNVTWMNTKVKLTQNGEEVNTVLNNKYTVNMYLNPYVQNTTNGQWSQYSGYYPAQGYFTVYYPVGGKFKIGLIPAYGQTEADLDKDKYEIYIYKNGAWVLHYKNGAWGHYENQDGNQVWVPEEDGEDGEAINKDTVYFQVRAAASQDGAQHKAQVNIWIQPNGSSEWISAYSEVRANYALTIPATN